MPDKSTYKIEHTDGISSIRLVKYSNSIYELHMWFDWKWPEVHSYWNNGPEGSRQVFEFTWYDDNHDPQHAEQLTIWKPDFISNSYEYQQVEKDTFHSIWFPWDLLKNQDHGLNSEELKLDLVKI